MGISTGGQGSMSDRRFPSPRQRAAIYHPTPYLLCLFKCDAIGDSLIWFQSSPCSMPLGRRDHVIFHVSLFQRGEGGQETVGCSEVRKHGFHEEQIEKQGGRGRKR